MIQSRPTFCFALVASCLFSIQTNGEDIEQAFRQHAHKEWERLSKKMEQGITYRFDDFSFRASGSNYVMVSRNGVFGANRHYGFELNRKDADSPWYLADLHDNEDVEEHRLDRLLPMFDYDFRNQLFMIGNNFSLLQYASDERFLIRDAKRTQLDGTECIEITFHFDKELVESYGGGYAIGFPPDGKIWVDPLRQWIVLRWEWWFPDGDVVMSGSNEDIKKCDGVFYPHRQTRKRENMKTGKILEDRAYTIEDISVGRSISKAEFYLPHFGLPEIERVKKLNGRNRLWLIGIAVAIGLVVLGCVIRFRAAKYA